jgi:hypothetical protein
MADLPGYTIDFSLSFEHLPIGFRQLPLVFAQHPIMVIIRYIDVT